MESSGIYSNLQPSMLGLEMSLHHNLTPPQNQNQNQNQNPQNPHYITHPPPHHPPMGAFAAHDHLHQSAKQGGGGGGGGGPKSKNQSLTLSDDDAADNSADDAKRKISPWQRMKWTDNMVRLLIMVVFYIGDEVGAAEAGEPGKKKGGGGGGGGGGALQKKGKWKSVSRAMMERGFYVSPQQCEDKFNDLNKRYKRVNDILGKGTSCRVVENQSLLDSMDLSPKVKEEVKKLLNSKHLFFREMCAYHNSCGSAAQHSPPQEGNACLHAAAAGAKAPSPSPAPNLNRGGGGDEGAKLRDEEEDDADGEDNEDDDEDDDDDDDDEDNENENEVEERARKRARKGAAAAALIEQLDAETASLLRDGGKTAGEKRQWLRGKMMALEEQRVGIQAQAFELEKQRLKWLKFSSKKEREMEREKLINEKTKLENERMVLLMRQKELGLIDLQHHHHHHHHHQQHSSNKKSDPSSITG